MTVFPDGTKERLHATPGRGRLEVAAVSRRARVADIAAEHIVPFASVKHLIADICATFKERILIAQHNRFLEIVRDDATELELALRPALRVPARRRPAPANFFFFFFFFFFDNISAEALAA